MLAIGFVTACGGGTSGSDVATVTVTADGGVTAKGATTVTVTETVFRDAPNAGETVVEGLEPQESAGEATRTAEVGLGETAVDDDIVIVVHSIEEVSSVALDPELDDAGRTSMEPIEGAKLIQVDLTYKNEAKQEVDPWCTGDGVILIDSEDNNYNTVEPSYAVVGNHTCSGIQPGFKSDERFVFLVPQDVEITGVALWNTDLSSPDPNGETYVVFVK